MIRKLFAVLVGGGVAVLAGCSADTGQEQTGGTQSAFANVDVRPTGKGMTQQAAKTPEGQGRIKPGGGANGISYHNGPIMTGTPNIYYIWYGNWAGNSATTILTSFAQNLGGSSYEHINSTYYDGAGTHVTGLLSYQGAYSVGAYLGTSLSDAQILQVVSDSVAGSHLAYDADGIYFVLTSSDVTASSGFCTQYCGWHNHGNISSGQKVRYSFVGNADRCLASCAAQTTSPNGNPGADGMASIIAHESEETISDPDGTGWYDNRGYENGDKCAWTFGTESTAANGSKYNITLGGAQYLIQQNWVNAGGGYCSMGY